MTIKQCVNIVLTVIVDPFCSGLEYFCTHNLGKVMGLIKRQMTGDK